MKKRMALWTINSVLAALWICFLGVEATSCDRDNCYHNNFQIDLYSEYPDSYGDTNVDLVTPGGIQVDTGGHAVNAKELDRRVNAIEECVLGVMRDVYAADLDIETQMAWGCYRDNFNAREKLKRDCLIIKVVSPAATSADGLWQLLNATAPDYLCEEKGLDPDAKHPCLYRVITVDENILVTPPALYLWDIVSIMTGCTQIWNNEFAKCAEL
jgi:hypothetical protein